MAGTDGNHDDSHAHGPPPPPEPKTPMWMPVVGGLIFLAVGLLWALSPTPPQPTENLVIPSGSAAAGAGAAPARAADPHGH